jgi:tRNA threonylcarbamoyl adenosine modification protein YeaZ
MKPMVAIEVSSSQGSLALFREGAEPLRRAWGEDRFRNQHLFDELKRLLDDAGAPPATVGTFVVGRGPGTFSSLRIALSLAQAAALPGRDEVYALSSGEALAAEHMAASSLPRVAVVGDARRGRLWYAVFDQGQDGLPGPAAWRLCTAETFLEAIPEDALVVTSCRERLAAALATVAFHRRAWAEGDQYPDARWLGRVYQARHAAGVPSEPLTPLYLHPPVR